MFLFKLLKKAVFALVLLGAATGIINASGCGSYVSGEHDIIDMTKPVDPDIPDKPGEEPTDPDDPDEPGTDEPDEPDTPDVFFTIGDKAATDGNFSFSYTDEQVYSVVSAAELGDIIVAVNPDIVEDLTGPRFPGLLTGNTYTLEDEFCMTEVMSVIFYVFQNNYMPFKAAADEYFNTGVPLCVISFENSDITYGILVDASDFATA